ncbi:hypothetical protein CCP3SC15_2270004 [Gammaproteobacteria bacterium]
MNKRQLAEQAKSLYEVELAKGRNADATKLKSLKADWDAKQAEADSDDSNVLDEADLKNIISAQMKSALADSGIPEAIQNAIKPSDIEAIVTKTLGEYAGKAKTQTEISDIATKSMKEVLLGVKVPSKFGVTQSRETVNMSMRDGSSSAGEITRGNIEFPLSLHGDRNNLPVHMKQLLNVMKTADFGRMNEGIDDATIRSAEERGQKMLESPASFAKSARSWAAGVEYGMKALDTVTAGHGLEYVAVELSSILQRRLYLESAVATLFSAREIDQPVENYLIPVRLALPEFRVGALQNTEYDKSDPGSSQPTLAAVKLIGETQYSYEADEASIIPMLPFVQEALSQGAAHGLERALISGHACGAGAAGTHQDYDVVDTAVTTAGSQPAEKLFNGLRRYALTVAGLKVNNSGAAANFDMFALMQQTMGIYGMKPEALVWIVGPKAMRRMKSIPQVQTAYAYGESRATIITGKLNEFDGIPVIPSQWMREDVAATGVNTQAGPNTFGSCLLVRPERFLMGRRRNFTTEIFRQPWTQTNRIIASFRRAFVPIETPSATIPSVIAGINWI